MVAIYKLAFLATAASAAVQKRDFAAVTADLSAISSSASILSTKVTAYTGGISAALPIQSAEQNVESAVKKATSDVASVGTVTSAQATTLITYVKNSLYPIIKNTLNALIAKKTQFNAAGLKGTVTDDLASLSSEANVLAASLVAKAPSANKPSASALSTSVGALFKSAISAYNA